MRPSSVVRLIDGFSAITLDAACAEAGEALDREEFGILLKAGIYTVPPWMR